VLRTQSTGRSSAEVLLTALYEQHAAAVFRYALHLTGRREDAEDVVQHVYIQAYRQLDDRVELVNPLAWLMKAAKYRSLNVIRDRREIPTESTVLEARSATDGDRAEAEELDAVRSMLWTLPESQHQAFVLRHWSGLSQTEIADVLGTTTSAVESLLVRARGALLDDRDQADGGCRSARRALVEGRSLGSAASVHVERCRRCRTARKRLLRATEFATAFMLVPRPHVAHAIASMVPGFSATAGAGGLGTAAGAATGSASAGASAVGSSVPLAAKGTIALKALAAVLTATVAVGAVQPIRQPIVNAIVHHVPGRAASQSRAHSAVASNAPKVSPVPGGAGSAGGAAAGVGRGRATAPGQLAGHGHAHATGKGQANPHAGGANGKAHGKSASAGGNGHASGKSATAGSNGKALGKSAGGGKGKAKGKAKPPASGAGKGKAKGKAKPPASGAGKGKGGTGNGNGNGAGNGKSAGAGSAKAKGHAP
jgi:RNA polymerase sigma factor (sigma-70 family)